MHVSLAPPPRREDLTRPHAARASAPMLASKGPAVVIGAQAGLDGLAQPIVPSPATLFGPRGAALAAPDQPLVVADTGHHRLLIWRDAPRQDYQEADLVIGQPDFAHEGRNAKGEPGPATLNVPTGVAIHSGVLAVADAWNHRVLIWRAIPERSNQPADLVLGQPDFASVLANRGGEPGPCTLNWCYGVSFLGDRLIVADTGNRRVLIWDRVPDSNGAPADRVLGQGSFECRDENAGEGASPRGMRWPHAVAGAGDRMFVSDAGNNRIMMWERSPEAPGQPCDLVLGQEDFTSTEHNRSSYLPDASSLNMPYAVACSHDWIIAADSANSRLVGWRASELAQGAAAAGLAGQHDFVSKGDNRWQMPARDSLCWPYGVTACGDTLVVSDSGNNRVMLWEMAS